MVLGRPRMKAHGGLDVRAWLYLEGASIRWFKGSTDPLSGICVGVWKSGSQRRPTQRSLSETASEDTFTAP
jgi:hypothetical protein